MAVFYSDIHKFYFHILTILTTTRCKIFLTYINFLLERVKEFHGVNGVTNFGGK